MNYFKSTSGKPVAGFAYRAVSAVMRLIPMGAIDTLAG